MSEVTKVFIDAGIFSRIEYRNSDGELHLLYGPAVDYRDGDCRWYINGERHREDGPAVTSGDYKEWWLNDCYLSFEDWCEQLNKSPEEITFLKLKYNI